MEKTAMIRERCFHFPGTVRRDKEEAGGRVITGTAIVFDTPTLLWRDSREEVWETIDRSAVTQEMLDSSDILMTMFHDPTVILARSNRGAGTLAYSIGDDGVGFSFEAPATSDGDKAVELVRRGDISGCSFIGYVDTSDPDSRSFATETREGKTVTTVTIRKFAGFRDFTLTPDPAYEETSVDVAYRDAVHAALHRPETPPDEEVMRQVAEMHAAADDRQFVIF